MVEIKGFQVLGVNLANTDSTHYIYYKKHEVKGDKSDNRALFMVNLPISSNLQIIKKFFSQVALGATIESFDESLLNNSIEDVYINLSKLTSELELTTDDPRSRLPKNSAIVTFVDKSALNLALSSLKKITKSVPWPVSDYSSSYYYNKLKSKILDIESLSQDVSSSLIKFDQAEAKSIQALKAQTEMVDEDGFTLVVGPHRKTKAGILGKQNFLKAQNDQKISKDKKQKQDFYKFQLRQKKKEEMNDLLLKFKADQEKVRIMREKKRFRPN